MRNLLTTCTLLALLSLLAACATTSPGLGNDSGTTRLPPGLTLLDSDEGTCGGTVQVDDDAIKDKGLGFQSELFVNPGENATFEFEDGNDQIEWACISGDSANVDRIRCPQGATHMRITRATTGGDLLFECYGRS